MTAAERRYERRLATKAQRACEYCSTDLPLASPLYRRFCNKLCGERAAHGTPLPAASRSCPECGDSLPAGAPLIQKYCRRSCKQRVDSRKRADYRRVYGAEWRLKNQARIDAWHAAYRVEHRSVLALRNRKNYAANPEPYKRGRDNRRARLLQPGVSFLVTPRDIRRMRARFGGRCAYCRAAGPLTNDHVIPLSRGGHHSVGNLLPACLTCNLQKQRRLIVEWRYGKSYRIPKDPTL